MVRSVLLLMITNILKGNLRESQLLIDGSLRSVASAKILKAVSVALVDFSKKLVVALPICIFLGILISFVYLDLVNLIDNEDASINPSFYLNLVTGWILSLILYFLFKKSSATDSPVEVKAGNIHSQREFINGENLDPFFVSENFFEDIVTSFNKGFQETYYASSRAMSLEEYRNKKQRS